MGSSVGVLGRRRGFLTGDFGNRVILDNMDVFGGPQGSYPGSFVSISLLKVCQGGFLVECTRRMLRVPDRRIGGQGHP